MALANTSTNDHGENGEGFSPRQNAVLGVALGLLVVGGERALTTSGLAKAAGCSKESLYKWFGDREGILAAIVMFQASKVRAIDERATPATPEAFAQALTDFAEDLLGVLLSQTSLALNRLSIGQAGLGTVLLEKGKRRIEARATHLLAHGNRQRFIRFEDAASAYSTLYGLIIGDLHIRALLGDDPQLSQSDQKLHAARAVQQFLTLHPHTHS